MKGKFGVFLRSVVCLGGVFALFAGGNVLADNPKCDKLPNNLKNHCNKYCDDCLSPSLSDKEKEKCDVRLFDYASEMTLGDHFMPCIGDPDNPKFPSAEFGINVAPDDPWVANYPNLCPSCFDMTRLLAIFKEDTDAIDDGADTPTCLIKGDGGKTIGQIQIYDADEVNPDNKTLFKFRIANFDNPSFKRCQHCPDGDTRTDCIFLDVTEEAHFKGCAEMGFFLIRLFKEKLGSSFECTLPDQCLREGDDGVFNNDDDQVCTLATDLCDKDAGEECRVPPATCADVTPASGESCIDETTGVECLDPSSLQEPCRNTGDCGDSQEGCRDGCCVVLCPCWDRNLQTREGQDMLHFAEAECSLIEGEEHILFGEGLSKAQESRIVIGIPFFECISRHAGLDDGHPEYNTRRNINEAQYLACLEIIRSKCQ